MEHDRKWMERAITLAEKGSGLTRPNPAVGCVIAAGERLLGEGFHRKAGSPHAEIEALERCGNADLSGATCYVTLEPCNHHGRTPPCTEAIIRSGIPRVVIACMDPNPGVAGGGAERLRKAGLTVETGLLASEAGKVIEAWAAWVRTGRPFVVLKMAVSLDGKVATHTGRSRWISGPESRAFTHGMRRNLQAIMAGAGTVTADDPALTARDGSRVIAAPIRIIVDSMIRSPMDSQVFNGTLPGKTIVAVSPEAHEDRIRRLKETGNEVLVVDRDIRGINLETLMNMLGRSGIESILLEGGPTLAFSMLESRLVNKVMLFMAPMLIGGIEAPSAVGGRGFGELTDAPRLRNVVTRSMGDDILLEGYLPV